MSTRNTIVAIITLVIVAAAWKISQDQAPSTDVSAERLYPELYDRLNSIHKVQITGADKSTELLNRDGTWVVSNRDGFAANFGDIKALLLNLSAITVVEGKTSKPENYPRLGVAPITSDSGDSVSVVVEDDTGTVMGSLIIGNKRSGGDFDSPNYYIRRTDDAQALLVEADLSVSADPQDWVDNAVVDVATKRVRRVSLNRNQEQPVVIAKNEPGENFFTLQGIPTGFEPTSRASVSSLGALLLDVKFEDVAAATRVEGAVPRTIGVVETFDGLIATLEQFDIEEHNYVRFQFDYNPDAVVEMPESESDTGEAADAAEAMVDVAAEAERLNASTGAWVYELADYKVRLIDKRFDDLIKPKEDKPTSDEEE